MKISNNEFHVSKKVRDLCRFNETLFASSGNVILSDLYQVRTFVEKLNAYFDKRNEHEKRVSAGELNAMGLIDEIFHYVCMLYRRDAAGESFSALLAKLDDEFGVAQTDALLLSFIAEFPPAAVRNGTVSAEEYLSETAFDEGVNRERTNREQTLEELILLHLANENPAFKKFAILFDDAKLAQNPLYGKSWESIKTHFALLPPFGPFAHDLISMLKEPVVYSPESLKGQLDYIRLHWGTMLGDMIKRLLAGIDTMQEEEKAAWQGGGEIEAVPYSYENLTKEYERFSADSAWMPRVVLIAKMVLVWLDQLSKKYSRAITRLDEIPDEELDILRDEGFTGLWLIGLWERSYASKRIKQINGNADAGASAYSLYDYEIAHDIGGRDALINLRTRLWQRGIRLASDMVPNHTGMDSKWVVEKPDLFVQRRDCPFPHYTFNGENLSRDGRVGIYLEDHYYTKTDCAVIFKRVDNYTGDVRYIYHGNDGTGLPWNDTAQIDFLNPVAREEVMREIVNVAKNFPIIRFDAAMVLAKKHIRRLWYPEPGHGGDIATRSETSLSAEEFNQAIPNEFWREVVDRIAAEVPDTLLLAEAFWMMEGYFVRTLGMHRVYNSAFMNMLKKEENQKYRDTIKNTLRFDPQVLKRFVNFVNNPDEETAVAQFGKGDKYFGVCTLMVTMPGLPMFGHGQIEGFEEKYGMEYTRAYRNEVPDEGFVARHRRDIFPLMKKRRLFADVENFLFYDLWNEGSVDENVFAYSNCADGECSIVVYNNTYGRSAGWIKDSVPYAIKTGSDENDRQLVTRTIADGLHLSSERDTYCIFREQRSGLYYIRENGDIRENGLFISLNGFESQVYTGIRQVKDTDTHKYRTLCEALAGRGAEDLDTLWEEIEYWELYMPLEAFAIFLIAKTESLLYSADRPYLDKKALADKVQSLMDEVGETALAFYAVARRFAEDAGFKVAPPEKQFRQFNKMFSAVVSSVTDAALCDLHSDDYEKLLKSKSVGDFIAFAASVEKSIPLLLICLASVGELAACGCAKEFNFARKFAEYIKRTGCANAPDRHQLMRVFALAPLAEKTVLLNNLKKAAYGLAALFVQSEDAALLSGNNFFDGIQWFNKELSDSSLIYFAAAATLYAPEGKKDFVRALYFLLNDAKINASFKSELFINQFAPGKGSKALPPVGKREASKITTAGVSGKKHKELTMETTTAKKPAEKKAAVKKTVAKKTTAKKPAAKTATKKAAVKKAPAKKTAASKTVAKKATAKKPVAKKTAAKKTVASKTTAKKTTAKKTAVKKTAAKKTPAKKTVAKKTTAKKTAEKK
ncbi:histone H1-like repetitive region-containing protein [Treponema socranskii]|uniref:histone H1-like repetitive region-containing protein n=1 Tax=Treponema socranskii TaxID=53419 RepID=UPI003D930F4B